MTQKALMTHPVDGCQGKGSKNIFSSMPHYYMPGLNTYSMNSIDTTDKAVQYYSAPDQFSLPEPYIAFSQTDTKINAVTDLIRFKTKWKYDHKRLLNKCRATLKLTTLNNIKREIHRIDPSCDSCPSVSSIPKVLTRLTSNLLENPDKYFDSDYNWYFKNTLEKFQIDGKWYLACARGTNLDNLDIVAINNDKFGTIENNKCFKGPILNIKSSNSKELMIRQKTKLFVFWNYSDVETLLNSNSVHDNCDIPLADADITTNNFCTADVEHVIKLWNDQKCVQDKYFALVNNQTDAFMQLSYLQNQTDLIAIIDRQKFYSIDTRTDISKPCSIYDPSAMIDKCEELTALRSSYLNEHSFYVASNHSVLVLDYRMGFSHKLYHMLSNPPSLITSHCYENSLEPIEMLLLGSQIGEGLVNVSYTSLQDDFLLSQNLASSIPKPLDALHKVRHEGHCLNPTLLDRFSRSLCGTTVFGEHMDNLRLFSINSAGDLFVQNLNSNNSIPLDIAKFEKLSSIKYKRVSALNYSHTFDMSKLWKIEPPEKFEETGKINVWSMSKEKMMSYVDHLAPLILSPWDIDDLSEWENEDKNDDAINDDFDCDYATKVHYWFNKNDTLLESPDLFEPSPCLPINVVRKPTPTNDHPASDNDEDSSSGFTLSLKSDDATKL